MRQSLVILFLIMASTVVAQTSIHATKSQVKRNLIRYINTNHYTNSTIRETDSLTTLVVRDSSVKPVDFEYYFYKGKCYAEKVVANCYACLEKRLAWTLDQKKFGWARINEFKYVSKYSKSLQMLIVKNSETDWYLDIREIYWGKEAYEAMIKGKEAVVRPG